MSLTVKRQRLEIPIISNPFLNNNVTVRALFYLDIFDLISFEKTAKKHKSITSFIWKYHRKENKYIAEWWDAEGTEYREKYNFMFSFSFKGIKNYCSHLNNLDAAIKIDSKYEYLKTFTNFGGYIEIVVGKNRRRPFTPSTDLQKKLNNIITISLLGHNGKFFGGDTLLEIFTRIENYYTKTHKKYFPPESSFLRAIELGATYICEDAYPYDTINLCVKAASVHKDFRYLIKYLEDHPCDFNTLKLLTEKHGRLGPLLFLMAENLPVGQLTLQEYRMEQEKILDEAYHDFFPYYSRLFLISYAGIKYSLRKYDVANYFFDIILKTWNNTCEPFIVVAIMGKCILKDYNNCEMIVNKVLKFNPNVKNDGFFYASLVVKVRLKKFNEAEELWLKIENKWRENYDLGYIFVIKYNLDKLNEAEALFKELYLKDKVRAEKVIKSVLKSILSTFNEFKELNPKLESCKLFFPFFIFINHFGIEKLFESHMQENNDFVQSYFINLVCLYSVQKLNFLISDTFLEKIKNELQQSWNKISILNCIGSPEHFQLCLKQNK